MLSRIKGILKQNGYVLYTRPYELNIVGIRSSNVESDRFDDEIHVFYTKEDGTWEYNIYAATTDPGTFWLHNPTFPQGTAILAQGQYVQAYGIGKHHFYDALVQIKPVTVIRDYDRDAILDFNNGTKEKGNFGINIHRASPFGTTLHIYKFSAGCQVFKNAVNFNMFMELCKRHAALYGNSFTYTLIDFRALRRITLKRIATATTLFGAVVLGYPVLKRFVKKWMSTPKHDAT